MAVAGATYFEGRFGQWNFCTTRCPAECNLDKRNIKDKRRTLNTSERLIEAEMKEIDRYLE